MTITALIAEDEEPQRTELKRMLEAQWPEMQIVAECSDGLSALDALQVHKPQVAFVDIRMPGVSGLEVARAAAAHAQVVFTTAYEEHAVQAFDDGAVDYLLKPIRAERLELAIGRVRARLDGGTRADLAPVIDALQAAGRTANDDRIRWITASAGNTVKMLSIDDVLFFQAQDKYTRVVTATEEAFIRTPLKELLAALDSQIFWQIHRSAIVRVAAIARAHYDDTGRLAVSIRGRDEPLPVSTAFHYRFKPM